ncbi:MAG TPA: hypothetical protein DEQ02_01805 [Ruminococcaceae bacterium]|nr:hypothetical protein [Oscillospiraceae bacterium]
MKRHYKIIESLSKADEAEKFVVYGIEMTEEGNNVSTVKRVLDISADKGFVGLLTDELSEKDVSAACLLQAIENYISNYMSVYH